MLCNQNTLKLNPTYGAWCKDCLKSRPTCLSAENQGILATFLLSWQLIRQGIPELDMINFSLMKQLKYEPPPISSYTYFRPDVLPEVAPKVRSTYLTNISLPIIWDILQGISEYPNEDFFFRPTSTSTDFYLFMEYRNRCFIDKNETVCQAMEEFSDLSNISEETMSWLYSILRQPKLHRDVGSGMELGSSALIPLCKYSYESSSIMEKCHLFKDAKHPLDEQSCYTFNGVTTNIKNGEKVSPHLGLAFVLDVLTVGPKRAQLLPAKLIIHEPGVAPDTKQFETTFLDIEPGMETFISVKPLVTATTVDFNGMSFTKRKCTLDPRGDNIELGMVYSSINCHRELAVKLAIEKCGCRLWFTGSGYNLTKICNYFGSVCFKTFVQNGTNYKDIVKCPMECKSVMYTAGISNQKDSSHFKKSKEIIPLMNYLDSNVVHSVISQDWVQLKVEDDYYQERYKHLSIVHINFDSPQVAVVTKDAKVSFADKLGNIGGTFGIFLGLSVMGLVDSFIHAYKTILKFFKSKCCNKSIHA